MPEELETNVDESVQETATDDTVERDIQKLYDEIQKLTTERDELQAQTLRTMADFQNFRRRTQQEAAQIRQFATERFVTDLLPVLDNFERTVAHLQAGASADAMMGGIQAVERQLRTVLEGQNIRRIPTVGEQFDPNVHEAIGMEPTADYPEDTIALEVEPGYQMGDKVIRPARVKVAKPA